MADFGLSESIDTSKQYFRQDKQVAVRLPIKWLAPESINDGIFSEKTDVVNTPTDSNIGGKEEGGRRGKEFISANYAPNNGTAFNFEYFMGGATVYFWLER